MSELDARIRKPSPSRFSGNGEGAMEDDGERRPEVSRPLVRLLADMVEASLKRDDRRRLQRVELAPKKSRRNGGPP